MQFEKNEYTVPEAVVIYLEYGPEAINDIDFTEEDAAKVDAFLKAEGLNGYTVWEYGEDRFFSTFHDLHQYGYLATTCITATAYTPKV